MRSLILSFCLIGCAFGEQFPKTSSESLTGQQVALPDSVKGHATVLVIGFTKSSQTPVKATEARLRSALAGKAEVYQIAVLEDAPRFVRGFITKAMKGSTPAELQGHFLIVVSGKNALEHAAGYSNSAENDDYVVVLDSQGEVVWRGHGALSDGQVKEIAERVGGK